MTIQRTRELLGDKVAHMTDNEILDLIQRTDKAADAMFQMAVKKAYEKKKTK